MGNALFIVWRESAEAMLIIGIVYAWLQRQPDAATGRRYLWAGIAAGVVLALLLAAAMLGIARFLSGDALDGFQAAMMFVAAGLIAQMVLWMRKHGRTLKRDLETRMRQNADAANWWGLAIVVALALGRETAEAVVFLYGVGMAQMSTPMFLAVLALGIFLAWLTFWLLQQGSRWLSWRVFFKLSEILLLLLAGGLMVGGIEKLIGMEVLPPIIDQMWDSTWLLDDTSRLGGFVASMTGYRAQPALMPMLCLAAYWLAMLWLMRAPREGVVKV
jgi:high-affinity iron transporter